MRKPIARPLVVVAVPPTDAEQITKVLAYIKAYDDALDAAGFQPNGEDYNAVLTEIEWILGGGEPSTIYIKQEDRQ